MEGKCYRKKARKDFGCLSKVAGLGRVIHELKERRGEKAWKVMMTYTREQGT